MTQVLSTTKLNELAVASTNEEMNKNTMFLKEILSRKNPQLQSIDCLGLKRNNNDSRSYEQFFGDRTPEYVLPGAVSSMFSPAAYLTQLYHEATKIRDSHSNLSLSNRRPDLTSLVLSQEHLTEEVSTLSLANEIMLAGYAAYPSTSKEESNTQTIVKKLNGGNDFGILPFDQGYETVRLALSQRDLSKVFVSGAEVTKDGSTFAYVSGSLVRTNFPALLSLYLAKYPTNLPANKVEAIAAYYEINCEQAASYLLGNEPLDTRLSHKLYIAINISKIIGLSANFFNVRAVDVGLTFDYGPFRPLISPPNYQTLLGINFLINKYGIDENDAVVLLGWSISFHAGNEVLSQFDSIFNNPPLNGVKFVTQFLDSDLTTSEWAHIRSRLHLNMAECRAIVLLLHPVTHDQNNTTTLPLSKNLSCDISDIYRVKLLADIHNISILELSALNSAMQLKLPKQSADYDYAKFLVYTDHVAKAVDFMRAIGVGAFDLQLMLTNDYGTVFTPEMGKFCQHFSHTEIDEKNLDNMQLIDALAPCVVSALQLPSLEMARALLLWSNCKNGNQQSIFNFWKSLPLAFFDQITEEVKSNIIPFVCQLWQLNGIVKALKLSAVEIELLLSHPTFMSVSNLDLFVLMDLLQFHRWIQHSGNQTPNIFDQLNGPQKGLSLSTIIASTHTDATADGWSETSIKAIYSKWAEVKDILALIQASNHLNIPAQDVKDLFSSLIGISQTPSQINWDHLSDTLLKGLTSETRHIVQGQVDQKLSATLTQYYIKGNLSPFPIADRNALYKYLLIDNLVSSTVQTTRIAEAIASLQLYINMALNGVEKDVQVSVLDGKFFTDWNNYNKRYSTWAGVSQLVFYPENYIDPTIRRGQTKLMESFQQITNLSRLDSDLIETAFLDYLSKFEDVSNLTVLNAYHNNEDFQKGLTYLLGASPREANRYYWRTLNQEMFVEERFPANAWTEWNLIDFAVTPYREECICLSVFQSRLYLVWVEENIAVEEVAGKNYDVHKFELKLSHIRHNGSWSAPISFNLEKVSFCSVRPEPFKSKDKPTDNKVTKVEAVPAKAVRLDGIYCVSDEEDGWLQIIGYQRNSDHKLKTVERLDIFADLSFSSKEVDDLAERCHLVADTPTLTKVMLPNAWNHLLTVNLQMLPNELGFPILVHIQNPSQKVTVNSKADTTTIKFNSDLKGDSYFIKPASNNDVEGFKCYFNGVDLIFEIPTFTEALLEKFIFGIECEIWMYAVGIGASFDTKIGSFRIYIQNENALTLVREEKGVQYLVRENYRIRLNTLFAQKLVSRASAGIDEILSMDTQKTEEVQLGPGHYLDLHVPSKALGSRESNNFKIQLSDADHNFGQKYTIANVSHSEYEKTINIFVPLRNKLNIGGVFSIAQGYDVDYVLDSGKRIFLGQLIFNQISGDLTFKQQSNASSAPVTITTTNHGVTYMDFNGANAIYFWELFYYIPMLIAQRLIQVQNFDEAYRWLCYIWNPAGYIENGCSASYTWNVRPLEEVTSWNNNPLDTVDADAVAQADPLHYKLSTFMHMLDLLIAKADFAYRKLERDTLAEAKLLYIQALSLLGEEPYISSTNAWCNPTLSIAAEESLGATRNVELMHIRLGREVGQSDARTANALTKLFYAQSNEKMHGYWKTLEQRLYNLRHGLSIDGQILSLPMYAQPLDPASMLALSAMTGQVIATLPNSRLSLHRFLPILDSARGMLGQLAQFGAQLLSLAERDDSEEMTQKLQMHESNLMGYSLRMQEESILEIKNEIKAIQATRYGATERYEKYKALSEHTVSSSELQSVIYKTAALIPTSISSCLMFGAAAADTVPCIGGLAIGGQHNGAMLMASSFAAQGISSGLEQLAGIVEQAAMYERRLEEWKMQASNAKAEVDQLTSQLAALENRQKAVNLQKDYLVQQQKFTNETLELLQHKFTNKELYSWLRGRLQAFYWSFYDLCASRCMMAQQSFHWETRSSTTFIKPGAWNDLRSGLLCAESLLLNLAQMETAYLQWDSRALEVTRTISMVKALDLNVSTFNQAIINTLQNNAPTYTEKEQELFFDQENDELKVLINLRSLKIENDYPADLGQDRRIKQINVTLPALIGPYQDIQAVLSCTEANIGIHPSCRNTAISHGMNDSGQFQLDFNDGKYLPFEGLPLDTSLTLRFPNATTKQAEILRSLTDIILHIRYTIRGDTPGSLQ